MAAVMAVIRFRYANRPVRLLCALIFFALFIESISRILWFFKISNLFLWPVYILVELGLLLWIYSIILENRFLRKAGPWLMLGFLVLVISRELVQAGRSVWIDNAGRMAESIMVIAFTIAYFYKIFYELKIPSLWREPFFWVSSGLLLFFSGNFLIFISLNFILLYSKGLNDQIWVIHAFLNYLLYSIYTFALWVSPTK